MLPRIAFEHTKKISRCKLFFPWSVTIGSHKINMSYEGVIASGLRPRNDMSGPSLMYNRLDEGSNSQRLPSIMPLHNIAELPLEAVGRPFQIMSVSSAICSPLS